MTNQTNLPSTTRERRGFHPKRFLSDLQQKFYSCQYSYLLFCFLVPVVLITLAYVILHVYLAISDPFDPPYYTGGVTPIVLDLNAQYMYFFEALRDFVHGDGSLLYSFGRSLGGEFMGIYAYYLASPLSYLVALFPAERIQEAVFAILLIKTGLSGATFGFYLHKKSKNPKKMSIFIFSMMYALCAFAVIQQNNTMWIDAMVWLPIFVYALENLITRRKYKLYVISLSAILISNYYIGYMVCIFAVLYFLYHYFSKSPQQINPLGERFHFVKTGSRFALFSIISAAISAFMLFAAYYSLSFGKTDFASSDWSMTPKFDILDFLVKLLPGSYDTVEPVGLPFVYCGILALILLPIYFTAKKIPLREKLASGALVAVFLLSFIINPLDLIWHGFSSPNWLNGRYSFMFCFLLLVLAYKAFGNLKHASDKFILGICGFLLLLVAVAEKYELPSFINANKTFIFSASGVEISGKTLWSIGCIWVSVFFIVLLGVLLCSKIRLRRKKNSSFVTSIIAAVVSIELLLNSVVCLLWFNEDVMFSSYDSYNDHLKELRPVVSQVTNIDNGFYRMEKTEHRTNNDNMALGLKGITSSTSTLNQKAIDFVEYMGYNAGGHLTYYKGGTPLTDSLFGIKYVIDTKNSPKFATQYNKIESIKSDKYEVYKNPNALSLAYGVDSSIKDFQFTDKKGYSLHNSYFARYNDLLAAMIEPNEKAEIFRSVALTDILSINCTEQEPGLKGGTKYTAGSDDPKKSGSICMTYTATYSGDYYLYVPLNTKETLSLSVERAYKEDGYSRYQSIYSSVEFMGSDSNNVFHVGNFGEGDTIAIKISIPEEATVEFVNESIPYLWNLNQENYNFCMKYLAHSGQFEIDPTSSDDHLTGSITTLANNKTILTTIPYDEAWSVYIDGKEIKTYETLGALMAFDIESLGKHTVEMKYYPQCYTTGLLISIFGILTFALICAADFVLKRTLWKNKLRVYDADFWILEDFEHSKSEAQAVLNPADTAQKEDEISVEGDPAPDQEPQENFQDNDNE